MESPPSASDINKLKRDYHELGVSLDSLSVKVNGMNSLRSQVLSANAIRLSLITMPLGIARVGAVSGDYWFGNKVVASHTLSGLARATKVWSALQTGWTVNEAANWVEVGGASPTGEFEYSGAFPASGVRKFLVTWAFNMYGFSNVLWWNMLGRVTKDSGSGHVIVPGSEMSSTPYAWYTVFAVHVEQHTISGSCVVSIASGDKIAFQFGNFVSVGAGTLTVSDLHTKTDSTGLQLTITPVDNMT
jgi:hypothetical protein